MNLLLDTHTFLWFINDDAALSLKAKSMIEDSENDLYLSVSSVWEIAIKVNLGKLTMPTPFAKFVDAQLEQNSISLLNITTAHAGSFATLPLHHRDPFDRLIIAQSLHEGFPIVGKDEQFDSYGVTRYW